MEEYKTYYRNGDIEKHWFEKGGKKHGKYKTWWDNGRQHMLISWKDGKQHGESIRWCRYGYMNSHNVWKDGKRHGESKVLFGGKIHHHIFWHNGEGICNTKNIHKYIQNVIKIQMWWRRRVWRLKRSNLFFLIECIPPGYYGTLGQLFPHGGYQFR